MALLGGSTVTKRAGRPKPATETATLASPPPKVATNWGDCRKRSKPGGASRSMISPKVTTVLLFMAGSHDCIGRWTEESGWAMPHAAGKATNALFALRCPVHGDITASSVVPET